MKTRHLVVTVLTVLLSLLLMMAATLGLCLVRLNRPDPHVLDKPDELLAECTNLDGYAPMARLFSGIDRDFLRNRPPRLIRNLRRGRRRAMLLFLGDVRRDFQRAWSVCWLLAPLNDDPDLPAMLCRQLAAFYIRYSRLRLRCLVGPNGHVAVDVEEVVGALRSLQTSAAQVLEVAQARACEAASA